MMNVSIKDFALKIGVEKDKVIEIVKFLGIRKTVLDDEQQQLIIKELNKGEEKMLDEKELKLKQFHEKIISERDKLKQEQDDFEAYKKSEEQRLKERLIQEEINYKTKLEDDFLNSIQSEYDKVKTKFDDLIKREIELKEKQQKLDYDEKKLQLEKELFESQKDDLTNNHKLELENYKKTFYIKLEEERVKKLEEINNTIENLYQEKESRIKAQEDELINKNAELKTKIAEAEAKEKALDSQSELIYNQEKEKVQEEIKTYQAKVKEFENQNDILREENTDLREELNQYVRFENRDLPDELQEKNQEISRLKLRLEAMTEEKNSTQIKLDNLRIEMDRKINELSSEIAKLRSSTMETESIQSENESFKYKIESFKKEVEFLQGENKNLKERLQSIYSDGTEIEERIRDIKEKPYKKIQLDSQISTTNEIKYLDSIQDNMKKYGVEYPRRLINAFHTALKCAEFSPLAVLSGVSGTGKSELPKLYSHFGGFNFLAEAVQPTWDSPASMIGYYNTIDRKFDSTNILKFLVQSSLSKNESSHGLKESMNIILLDEMNLAHIELYFAEFLSKFEQRRGSKEGDVNIDIQLGTALIHKLPLDRNMLWIGTMNEDETTKSLSDKVLDRAFSINFPRPTELKSRVKLQSLEDIKTFEYLHRNTWDQWIKKESLFIDERSEAIQKYKEITNKINEHLAPTGRAIGHRVWQSMEYYISNHPDVIQNIGNEEELNKKIKLAFEDQLVQKIMPKLRGIEVHGKEKDALMNIKAILNQNEFAITEDFELSIDNPYGQFIWNSANYLKEY